jgi:hypothetical protein
VISRACRNFCCLLLGFIFTLRMAPGILNDFVKPISHRKSDLFAQPHPLHDLLVAMIHSMNQIYAATGSLLWTLVAVSGCMAVGATMLEYILDAGVDANAAIGNQKLGPVASQKPNAKAKQLEHAYENMGLEERLALDEARYARWLEQETIIELEETGVLFVEPTNKPEDPVAPQSSPNEESLDKLPNGQLFTGPSGTGKLTAVYTMGKHRSSQ